MKYNEKYGLYVTKNGLIFTVDRRYKEFYVKDYTKRDYRKQL